MRREPSTAADYAAVEAADEWAIHGDDDRDPPDLDDRPSTTGATGPGPHTHDTDPQLTCFPCLTERGLL